MSYEVNAIDVRYVHDQIRSLRREAEQARAKGSIHDLMSAELLEAAADARDLALTTLCLPAEVTTR